MRSAPSAASWGLLPNCSTAIRSPVPAWRSAACARTRKRRRSEWTKAGFFPVRSVGVQGDSRTYRPVLAVEAVPATEDAIADLTNRRPDVNRIIGIAHTCGPIGSLKVMPAHLTGERHRSTAPRRRHRAQAVARVGLRSNGLAISGGADSVGYAAAARFRGAAPHRFGGWNDGARGTDSGGLLGRWCGS